MKTNLDRWCEYCGRKMIVKTKYLGTFYNRYTGDKIKEPPAYHYWKCPSKRWTLDNHSEFSDKLVSFQ